MVTGPHHSTPKSIKITKWRDYTEANAWQTTFCMQHDPALLIETLGGNQPFVEKLDQLFNQSSELPPDIPPDVTGMVGQYAQGNEPSHHISVEWNGSPVSGLSIDHAQLAKGGTLVFHLVDEVPAVA
jgi:putative alpha-1,2-mannosidase